MTKDEVNSVLVRIRDCKPVSDEKLMEAFKHLRLAAIVVQFEENNTMAARIPFVPPGPDPDLNDVKRTVLLARSTMDRDFHCVGCDGHEIPMSDLGGFTVVVFDRKHIECAHPLCASCAGTPDDDLPVDDLTRASLLRFLRMEAPHLHLGPIH